MMTSKISSETSAISNNPVKDTPMSRLWESVGKMGHPDASRAARTIYDLYEKSFRLLFRTARPQDRCPIYKRDWDVLVVLDGCRVDLLKAVAGEYPFVNVDETVESVGSASFEWLVKNFTEKFKTEVAETAHVTGNVKTNLALDPGDFLVLDEVWKYAWDEEIGTIRPRPITDRAIRTWRDLTPGRMIIHYMQPHFPSLSHPDLGSKTVRDMSGGGWESYPIWDRLRVGEVTHDEVWEAYMGNLEVVLEDVELLLESINAETVVITSDHGNAMGEFGFYDHPGYHPLSVLREVPWCTTTANKTRDYEPEEYHKETEVTETTVKDRLESLGYV